MTNRLRLLILLEFAFTSVIGSNVLQDTVRVPEKVRVYETVRLSTEKPKIDGVLDDACWSTGTWAGDFIQFVPNEGAKPSQPTEVKVLYDDQNIYVAIRNYDDPAKIHRKAGRRDEMAGDMAGITFDSYHDRRTGFEFDMTAAGQKIDLVLTNPMDADYNWNAVWYGKTGMEDSAWIIEMEIPLSQLRYSNEREQVWGMHVWRWIDRNQEESDWEPQSFTGPGALYLFGELHGIQNLKKSQRLELMPYAAGKVKTYEKEPGNPFADKGRTFLGNIGLDAKIGVGSNFTVDLTLNPDFGQVESDPSVMNLTAYETFYEEKRPFFLEGNSIFHFETNDETSLFYSRRIGHSPSYSPDLSSREYLKSPDNTTILSAVKFSGKTANGLSVGIIQSLTANEKATLHTPDGNNKITVEPMTNYLIGRIQKDINKSNTIVGGMFTSTHRFINDSYLNFLNREAYTGGIDLLHQWNDKEFFIQANLVGSHIQGEKEAMTLLQKSSAHYYQRPDARHIRFDSTLTQLSGYGGKIKIGKGSKGLWRYSTEINWRSPGIDINDIGYMQTADIITQSNELSYFVNKPVSIFRTYRVELEQFNNWDFSGMYLNSGAEFNLHFEFLNKWSIFNSMEYYGNTLDTRILRGGNAMLMPSMFENVFEVNTDQSRRVNGQLGIITQASPNESLRLFGINAGISVRPADKLRLSLFSDYSVNSNNLQYVDTKESNTGKKYILARIDQETLNLTFRVDYNITPEFSIQYYGSPFASLGSYSDFKLINNPKADEYRDRYQVITPESSDPDNSIFMVRENNDSFDFNNPDFNFNQMRSNLVFRWEYRPGSQIYLVWSNERTDWLNPGTSPLRHAASRLADTTPDNIFMVKFNYWFSI